MIVLAIAATRMYRSVDNPLSPRETTPGGTKRTVLSDMRARPVQLTPTGITVPTTEYGQYPTSQSGSGTGSYVSTDPHKTHEVSFNVDVESGLEK